MTEFNAFATGAEASIFRPYAFVALFVFPFIVVRKVSADEKSGAFESISQSWRSLTTLVLAQFGVLLGVFVATWVPGLIVLGVGRVRGESVRMLLVVSVLLGHLLRAALVISLAMIFAAANRPVRALILTLAFSLAMLWVAYMGQTQGGLIEQLAQLTPEGMLRAFDRGEIRLDIAYVFVIAVASNLVLAVAWMHRGLERGFRWAVTAVVLVVTSALTALAS